MSSLQIALAALGFGVLLGCQPSIGSSCLQSTDCSTAGDRLCDTSQPNGYCTIFNCQPNLCPSGSGCMLTNAAIDGCPYNDRHAPSRLSEQLCLSLCNQDSDCREGDGYACIVPAQYGILTLDNLIPNEKVCLPATTYTVNDAATDAVAPVCNVSGPPVPAIEAGPGYQGNVADAASE
jgi:hypothetical protein